MGVLAAFPGSHEFFRVGIQDTGRAIVGYPQTFPSIQHLTGDRLSLIVVGLLSSLHSASPDRRQRTFADCHIKGPNPCPANG